MERRYPIELEDIERARLKIANRKLERTQEPKEVRKMRRIPVSKRESTKKKIGRAKRVIAEVKKLPVLPLSEAIKRLGDDEIYRKASKGFRFSKD